MEISLDTTEDVTIYVHGSKGHPVIEHAPELPEVSTRKCTVFIGKIEIAILKKEGKG